MKIRVYYDYEPVKILKGVEREIDDALAQTAGVVGAFIEMDDSQLPDYKYRDFWKVVDGSIVYDKQAADKKIAEKNFNWKNFSGRLNQVMAISSIIKLSQFLGTLQGMCEWPNFEGVKGLLAALVGQGIMTQTESDQITACLLEQGINLNDY